MKSWMLIVGLLVATVGCSSESTSTTETSMTEIPANATHVSLKVPDMECPFACWPKVEKVLQEQPGVESVTLAPQEDENIIDNPS
ncbi:MAG: heavy-metal-associated domain-containing protein [Pirellulaceae bacterium]